MILLVNPPVNRLCEFEMNYYPLGLGYLAACLKERGEEVRIYNAETSPRLAGPLSNRERIGNHRLFVEAVENDRHEVWEEFRQVLAEVRPAVVGFSCTSASIVPCLKMAREVKSLCGATTVFGGMHPTLLPRETALAPEVDYVVTGEGEESFADLVGTLKKGKLAAPRPGVGHCVAGEFRYQPPAPLERDLDRLPFPDRNCLIFPERNRAHLNSIVTSRGCPYRCTYCAGKAMHCGTVRYRDLRSVLAELRLLKERYGCSHVRIYDDAFVLKRDRVVELCRLLRREKLGITWSAFTRADSVDSELLRLMLKSGCLFLGVGVESGSDRILSAVRKGYTREQALKGIRAIKKAGIEVGISVMVGLPMEREEDIRQTITLIEALQVPTNVNTFTPYPGSEIYEECLARGIVDGEVDWARASQHSLYNAFAAEVSPERYQALLDEMLSAADRFRCFTPSFLRRVERQWIVEGRRPGPFAAALLRGWGARLRQVLQRRGLPFGTAGSATR